jgi:hypothetical protein
MDIPEWVKPAALGAAAGAVAIAFVGFNAGWVLSNGSADRLAQTQSDKAVLAALTPICVAQFGGETEQVRTSQLAALNRADAWQRGEYVGKQGWATMPGSKMPNRQAADACALELMKLVKN